jgi:hypothetical protein
MRLTVEQKGHLREFGIDVENIPDSEAIDELIKIAYLFSLSCEFTERQFLEREIRRVLKPSN